MTVGTGCYIVWQWVPGGKMYDSGYRVLNCMTVGTGCYIVWQWVPGVTMYDSAYRVLHCVTVGTGCYIVWQWVPRSCSVYCGPKFQSHFCL